MAKKQNLKAGQHPFFRDAQDNPVEIGRFYFDHAQMRTIYVRQGFRIDNSDGGQDYDLETLYNHSLVRPQKNECLEHIADVYDFIDSLLNQSRFILSRLNRQEENNKSRGAYK